ncbi:MAG TPA: hypothetical protein VK753_03380 [Xanthomonadaceae bacterium]|jgi:quercetin dioxygenase-like cupin family protein|nr:hypothetical protein [Xanthomonadaceae bacterium]
MTIADPPPDPVDPVVACDDLDAAIAAYTERGYRLDMIMPADAPRIALLSRDGTTLRLEAIRDRNPLPTPAGNTPDLVLRRADDHDAWPEGRAGMQYRDLIPGRVGGHAIASHIRIPDGGPVPDYVHHHKVGFQMIYCRRGWVRVVYEDQGPSFVMHAGDCVLQPPTIRHRVLESSAGLEVVEVSSPALHETWRDHELELPTPHQHPERVFGGQHFVRHVAANAFWQQADGNGFEFRDTGISDATHGRADVRVLRTMPHATANGACTTRLARGHDLLFLFVLEGRLQLHGDTFGTHALQADDACAMAHRTVCVLEASAPCEVLAVVMSFASSPA